MSKDEGNQQTWNPGILEELGPAANMDEVFRRHDFNRQAWNEGAEKYRAGLGEAATRLIEGKLGFHEIERRALLPLKPWCKVAIHLQCASAEDTVSLCLAGAEQVIGLDISEQHIANAKELSKRVGISATWYCLDVLKAPSALDGTADLVYTGKGSLNWVQDIAAWARVVARLLKPGGRLYLWDSHPLKWLLVRDQNCLVYNGKSYFDRVVMGRGWPSNFIGDLGRPVANLSPMYRHIWTLSQILQALMSAGLRIEQFTEHPEDYWDTFPDVPAAQKVRLPMTFSLMARRPADSTCLS